VPRPNRSGPRLSALAVLATVCLLSTLPIRPPASAQDGDAAAERAETSRELERIESDLASGKATKQQLDRLARDLAEQVERLRAQMRAAATNAQRTEATMTEVETRLAELEVDAAAKQAALGDNDRDLSSLTGALQRLARRPPEQFLMFGTSPLELAQTGILLESAIPAIDAETARLKREVARLNAVETDIRQQRSRLADAAADLDRERARLTRLADEKAALLTKTNRRAASTDAQLQELTQSARSLRDLMDVLEERAAREQAEQDQLASLVRPGAEAGGGTEPTAPLPVTRPDGPAPTPAEERGASADPPLNQGDPQQALLALLPDAPPITAAKGDLMKPVSGTLVSGFGDPDPIGLRDRGLVLATRPGGTVVAPYDGRVIHVGRFRELGEILIIEHGEGYHTLLAGMDRPIVTVGQRILAGEPIGTMGRGRTGSGDGTPAGGVELYVELRHNGDPIDPYPWFGGL